jgi:hypothetical protein
MPSPVHIPTLLTNVADDVLESVDIVLDLPDTQLVEIEYHWAPERKRLPPSVEHRHWNWGGKTGKKTYRLIALLKGDSCEGLLAVETKLKPSRHDQRDLLYIGYIESAPWNLEQHPDGQRYRGVGTSLMIGAIQLSQQTDAKGGICLHSLDQSRVYYQHKWGMKSYGPDDLCEDMDYFELAALDAIKFLAPRTLE